MQIRICSKLHVFHSAGMPIGVQAWIERTPETLESLRMLVLAGEEVDGIGTYWIEQRDPLTATAVRMLEIGW